MCAADAKTEPLSANYRTVAVLMGPVSETAASDIVVVVVVAAAAAAAAAPRGKSVRQKSLRSGDALGKAETEGSVAVPHLCYG